MLSVPQLGGDEEVLTLQTRDILIGTLDARSNLTLVLVDRRQVQMTVTCLQGLVDSLSYLARGRLPGAKTQLTSGGRGTRGQRDVDMVEVACGKYTRSVLTAA